MGRTMLDHWRHRRTEAAPAEEEAEAGFTLIELMVVLLILAILMAIAIPTFLGVTKGANDRAAQSNLSNAVTEAGAVYQGNSQSFATPSTGTIASAFSSSAPEFGWTTGACSTSAANCISYDISTDGNEIILGAASKTGACWYVLYSPGEAANKSFGSVTGTSGVTIGNAGTYYATKGGTNTSCTASTAESFQFGVSFSQPGSN